MKWQAVTWAAAAVLVAPHAGAAEPAAPAASDAPPATESPAKPANDVTAGYSSYSMYGENVFETRGQKAGAFVNNKHLVLIDGIPVNHGRGNSAIIGENFPLFFANRVEFLKGPASALYGTGAFFGVVNVV